MPQATPPSRTLAALASAHGVAVDYWDWRGEHVVVSTDTIVTVLGALGVDASTEEAAAAALAALEDEHWREVLPPTVVARAGRPWWVPVHVPHGRAVRVLVELEGGGTREARPVDRWVDPRVVDGDQIGEATVELPGDLPLGWHVLHAEVDGQAPTSATLVVTPERLEATAVAGPGRLWGLTTQLYQVRSERSWGLGDLADLADLAAWGADLGADFVLVNPLHAAEPVAPMEPSPYLPTTRRFANPMYLRVEDVPEVAHLDAAGRAAVDAATRRAKALNADDVIDRDAVWAAKDEALRVVFAAGLRGHRAASFARFEEESGEGLRTYATWCALACAYGLPAARWPTELADPRSPEVARFREEEAEEVRYHAWLQWLLDEQLGRTQQVALAAGMSVGVLTDLAVGVHPEGADVWALRPVLAEGVTVGAPPDQFNQLGQNWHQPPWHPRRLAEAGYAPFRDMVRAVLRHSGGVRVDHVIGLFRLWWVPSGQDASAGTYVRYDHEALVGILALEAQRAGALVVGEDLGVVEPMARDVLRERGILGTSILWFEWTEDGRPRPPEGYRELCLASVTTHDLPPTAGYLDLAHVTLRERLGLLTRPVEEEAAVERGSIDRVRAALVERGLLADGAGDEDVVVALHGWLARTPARLLGVSLSDLVGDRRIINQPGTEDEYPNWRVPLSGPDGRPMTLEQVCAATLPTRITAELSRPGGCVPVRQWQ